MESDGWVKAIAVTVVGGLLVYGVVKIIDQTPSISVAGEIKSERGKTLIPLRTKSTLPVVVQGYQFSITALSQEMGAMIPEEPPLKINADDLEVGEWYQVKKQDFQVTQEVGYLPIVIKHSDSDYATVDIRILYGDDPSDPYVLEIDDVLVNTRRP